MIFPSIAIDSPVNSLSPLESLLSLDRAYPTPSIIGLLQKSENEDLLQYIVEDPFGSHVFPGNIRSYEVSRFLEDANEELSEKKPFHFWINFPLCEKRCAFCQYAIVAGGSKSERIKSLSKQWIEAIMREAELWLAALPNLNDAPVGEFNLFGGTPSLIPREEMGRLMDFLYKHFNFTGDSTLRIEGNADSFSRERLLFLKKMGFSKVSIGIQSFDDEVLKLCNVSHTGEQAIDFIKMAQDLGFDRINGDLIYGLLNQTVASVEKDMELTVDLRLYSLDCSKLHLKDYKETGTGIAGNIPAAWQKEGWRFKEEKKGRHWPALGEQLQMREIINDTLTANGYREHPTMYFSKEGYGPERWKSMMVDQDKQCVEIAMGLGGSSSCEKSEAHVTVEPDSYLKQVEKGQLPLHSARGFNQQGKLVRAIRMALSTCQALSDKVHRERWTTSSLFDSYWLPKFESLRERGFVKIDKKEKTIELTHEGKIIVEAIMHREIY
ncbi:MAG: radical SAM protein [Deltaproteobacteria bacterium]|nr:radical SAM protein [Deltaproteobacteria bacterium]